VVSDQKIIVYPFKLPNFSLSEKNKNLLERSLVHIQKPELHTRYDYIFNKYAIPYNQEFLLNCFINMIEALADMKDEIPWERTVMRKQAGENPLRSQMLYMIGRQYKDHPYYNFLYSKSLAPLAVTTRKSFGVEAAVVNTAVAKSVCYLPFYKPGATGVETKKLMVDKGEICEVYLEENSQYLIDYSNLSYPTVYLFNTRIRQKTLGVTTYGPVSHISFEMDLSDYETAALAEYSAPKEILVDEDLKDYVATKNFGLCKCESLVFQVYGTRLDQEQVDTNQIFSFDFSSEKYYKLNLREEGKEIIARHGVTTCAFKRGGMYYLYVFGGQVQNNVLYKGKNYGSIDIIDIVEVYWTEDPRGKADWDYKIFPKSELTKDQNFSFIPFKNSFAYYDEKKEEILLMGGSSFVNSVYDWNFSVFVFDVKTERFKKFESFLNEIKGNSERKKIKNTDEDCVMTAIPMAVADINKNFFYNAATETFEFMLMNQLNNIGCNYSYNREASKCDFTQSLMKLEDKTNRISIAPPALNRGSEESKKIPLEVMRSLSYLLAHPGQKELFVEMILWRLSVEKTEITFEEFKKNFVEPKKEILNEKIGQRDAEGEMKKILEHQIELLDQIEKLFEQKEYIRNLFLKKSPELEVAKKQLMSSIDSVSNSCCVTEFKVDTTLVIKPTPTPQDIDEISFSVASVAPSQNQSVNIEYLKEKKREAQPIASSSDVKSQQTIKDYSIIDNSQILQQSYSRILPSNGSVENFKECLATPNPFKVFVNKAKNGIIVQTETGTEKTIQNLLFKVLINDELEELSFNLTPSSVTIYQGAIICYIDQQFKMTHPHIYEEYKQWILYADLNSILTTPGPNSKRKYIIFERLIHLNGEDPIYNRHLLVNQQSLFLFGGKTVKFKGKNRVNYHKNVSRYDLKKLIEYGQKGSTIKDADVDAMESVEGECTVLNSGGFIYICQKNSPQDLEIFKEDGTVAENIELDMKTEGYTAYLNPIIFEEKPHILMTLCKVDEDMKFLLCDILNKAVVGENITIAPKGVEVAHPLFYSGFEEIEIYTGLDVKNELLIYNYRGDEPRVIHYEIKIVVGGGKNS